MSNVSITYYGHACFKVSYEGKSVLFDPYQNGSVPGLTLPRDLCVDACFCSHGHADHNAQELVHVKSQVNPFPTGHMVVPHDEEGGRKRGMSTVTLIECGLVTIAHLGDYGRLPTPEEYGFLRKADVLLVPCGGYYTIDSFQAKELIEQCGAPLALLMHYRKGNTGYEVLADISQIRKVFGHIEERTEHTLSFDHVPKGVMTLEPCQ